MYLGSSPGSGTCCLRDLEQWTPPLWIWVFALVKWRSHTFVAGFIVRFPCGISNIKKHIYFYLQEVPFLQVKRMEAWEELWLLKLLNCLGGYGSSHGCRSRLGCVLQVLCKPLAFEQVGGIWRPLALTQWSHPTSLRLWKGENNPGQGLMTLHAWGPGPTSFGGWWFPLSLLLPCLLWQW